MSLIDHMRREFKVLGWPGDEEMQEEACGNIEELVDTFAKQGHSGSSAEYVLQHLERLLRFKPLSPLTGEDDEWVEVGPGVFQNIRFSEVFKENDKAQWIQGKVFIDTPTGAAWTSKDSRVDIEFPWMPPEEPEYVYVEREPT